MTAATKGLSKTRQSLVMGAFAESFSAAQTKLEARVTDEMETYYAARMTDDEIRTVIDFYGAGLGYKMLHDVQNVTPEERQKFGLYMFGHPALIKLAKLSLDYIKSSETRRQASQAIFTADFNTRFCQALARDHLKIPKCQAPGLQGASQ